MNGIASSMALSSVVPANATSENTISQFTNMDLAMKLHYINGVYFFKNDASKNLTFLDLKAAMFPLLNLYYGVSGRIRVSENGRPYIKCNDSGVRTVEARCDMSLDEWLQTEDRFHDVVYDHVLGPDLGFSPLVYIQFTKFKCGGLCVGLSWAHVLGDVFSASSFINMWGKILSGHATPKSLGVPNFSEPRYPKNSSSFIKQVDTIEKCWVISSNSKMSSHNFRITTKQLERVIESSCGKDQLPKTSYFELMSAIFWKCLSRIREDLGPRTVTICTNNNSSNREIDEVPNNRMIFFMIEVDFCISKSDIFDLASLIIAKMIDDNGKITQVSDEDVNKKDVNVYGANLTFVNLDKEDIYGVEVNGQKPVYANYMIKGVGEEGAVMVFPGLDNNKEDDGGGYSVNVILPENQLVRLRNVVDKYVSHV